MESEDSGLTWSRIETVFAGDAPQCGWPHDFARLFLVDGTELRAATSREFMASRDGGRTWSLAGLSKGGNALVRLRDVWYAATWDGVFHSGDLARWTECSSGLDGGAVRSLTATPEGISSSSWATRPSDRSTGADHGGRSRRPFHHAAMTVTLWRHSWLRIP